MRRWKLNAISAALTLGYVMIPHAMAQEEAKQSDEEAVEVIQVKGIQYSDQQARLMEREKSQFSSVVSTDDLGNFVDQNVAESLRRLPGVSLQRSEGEGKFVNVRGLGPQFVAVNMNGAEMAGAGEDRKVGLDGIAGDSLGAIEVFKTLTPDMNLNSIGGAVNVKSISAYDRGGNSLKLKVQDSYNDLREKHSPKFTLDGTHLFADETIGIGFVASMEDRYTAVNEQRHHSTNTYRTIRQWDPNAIDEETGDLGVQVGDAILAPYQVETRQEVADRERDTVGLNLEFRPNDDNYFYVKGNYVRFTDEDVAYREYYRFDKADKDNEIMFVDAATKEFVVTDAELQHQYFIQESEQKVKTFSIGGEHVFNDVWTLEYDYSKSRSREDSVDDRRVQFREQNIILYGQATQDEVFYEALSPEEVIAQYPTVDLAGFGSYDGDAANPDNWEFDNMFLEDSIRRDEIETFKADLTYTVDSDWLYYIKAGFAISERMNELDKNRWSFVPTTDGCTDTYAADSAELAECYNAIKISQDEVIAPVADGGLGYSTGIPKNSNFQYPFVDKKTLEYLTGLIGPTKYAVTGYSGDDDVVSFESSANDYKLTEDVNEVYVMAEFELHEDVTLITGVRYVDTEFSSNGNLALSNDEFAVGEGEGAELDVFVPMPQATITYSEYFPSAHLRWEADDDLLVRASIWTSYTRPTFKQNRAYAQFKNDIELCMPSTEEGVEPECYTDNENLGASAIDLQDFVLGPNNTLDLGNPNLVPMTATNFDASISWYESEDLFIEAAIFYKDIDDFIVDVQGYPARLDELPVTLPVGQVTEFIIAEDTELQNINTTINGDSAWVYGMELSYNQFFDWGGFVQSNLTVQDSEADLDSSIRDDSVPLPDQADVMGNLTVGWENDDWSFRLIGNYRSKVLEEIGSCPAEEHQSEGLSSWEACKSWTDKYHDEIKTLDFKAKWNVIDGMSIYFDAINITEHDDIRYYKGNALTGGKVLSQREEYGRTYQVGVNYKFY
ncbi:TonB-dependent receptor [Neiella sp. HB171785]|uniref:TonB-dependent receptor n=1 Tax=Neiella litorisoli TaxID=2771431 RepID=A0A8J6UFP0_9GAMM|nr:TonB-dependent receptor [Neiella litorisoli]MBD1389011.1 TonB-dependent receptor [Neiella litorisoli]